MEKGATWTGKSILIFNTLRPRQNGRRFADDTFKRIFLNENVRISIKISLKFVRKGPINNNPPLVRIMAWRWSGDKPLSEPMMVSLLTHICVTRPQWVKECCRYIVSISYINIVFKSSLALCAGNSPVTGKFPAQRPVTCSFDVFSDLTLIKRLSKQSWGWWSETSPRSLWRQCNVY